MAGSDDVVFVIDVETYIFPETYVFHDIIFIDDDDDDEEAAAPPRSRRKRKNPEQMRQEEVERRQKQRVEELRETRKKEEEAMKLKDKIRDSVQKKLQRLERSCYDMASLLKSLGILASEQYPSPSEVSSAYKKALLRFHPDRTSASDFRRQVEAEEKFKLLLRIKNRFSL